MCFFFFFLSASKINQKQFKSLNLCMLLLTIITLKMSVHLPTYAVCVAIFFFYHDFLDTKIPVRVVIDLSDCSIHCRKLLSCYAITLITSCTWECIHVLNNGNMTVNIFETLHSEHIRHFTHSKIQMHHQLCWSSGFNLMMTAVLQMITSMALKIVMFGSTYRCKM